LSRSGLDAFDPLAHAVVMPVSHYKGPALRQEAERRFAAGESRDRVIADLRERHVGDVSRVPAVRTMRRGFAKGRWLARPRTAGDHQGRGRDEPPASHGPALARQPAAGIRDSHGATAPAPHGATAHATASNLRTAPAAGAPVPSPNAHRARAP